jgi:hypothetical protein
MKNKLNQAEKDALAAVNSKSTQAILRHVLSPLEQAALRHSFRPFRYNLKGAKIYISGGNSRQLLHGIMHKIEQLTFIITKEQSSRQIPLRLREVFDDPAIVLSITPIVRNQLCRLECYTLFSIMQRGKTYFIEKGLGKQAMQTLEALFAKHEVLHLFK